MTMLLKGSNEGYLIGKRKNFKSVQSFCLNIKAAKMYQQLFSQHHQKREKKAFPALPSLPVSSSFKASFISGKLLSGELTLCSVTSSIGFELFKISNLFLGMSGRNLDGVSEVGDCRKIGANSGTLLDVDWKKINILKIKVTREVINIFYQIRVLYFSTYS